MNGHPATIYQHRSAKAVLHATLQAEQPLGDNICTCCGLVTDQDGPHWHRNERISCDEANRRSVASAKEANEAEKVRDIAQLLAVLDGTQRLDHPANLAHYTKIARIARRLSTMGPERYTLDQLTELEGADGCANAYYDSEDMGAPYLTTNSTERELWTAVFQAGFQKALDFLGRVNGAAGEQRIAGVWRSVTGAQS